MPGFPQSHPPAVPPRTLPPAATRLPPPYSRFAKEVPFERRLQEAEHKLMECPDLVPVVLEVVANERSAVVLELTRRKFLIPSSAAVSIFHIAIRRRLKLDPSQSIFFFVNNQVPVMSMLMGQLYQEHQANDRFLYMQVGAEVTFGAETDE